MIAFPRAMHHGDFHQSFTIGDWLVTSKGRGSRWGIGLDTLLCDVTKRLILTFLEMAF